MAVKVGINGFGRIGRQSFKAILEKYRDKVDIVGINDITDPEVNAHLLRYDSTYGRFEADISVKDNNLVVNGDEFKVFAERDPANIPWGDLGAEIVLESTGIFRDKDSAGKHIQAGAKKVIISAPAKGEDITIVLGVNEDQYDAANHNIISNASCTTNCLAPICKVLDDNFGIEQGFMTTVHAYTNDQRVLDLPHKDLRRARAAALNIIPTTTGAAAAIGLVMPHLKGKLDGLSLRVPTPTVSIVDLVATLSKSASVTDVNGALKAAADGPMKGILVFEEAELVSTDFRGSEASSIVDGPSTMAQGKVAKVLSWYDNEWGYSTRVADLIVFISEKGL